MNDPCFREMGNLVGEYDHSIQIFDPPGDIGFYFIEYPQFYP